MGFITLTTDFGISDGYAGVLKGVIWSVSPETRVADISHLINPQNILHGALILARHALYFPPGTVHLAVVDPGVGTSRRPMAARIGSYYFCGPDNGLASLLLDAAERKDEPIEMVCLDQPRFWLADISSVFHGRDIFAPAAAHLACGVGLGELGTPFHDPVRIHLPAPQVTDTGIEGQVLYTDHFGNLITNLDQEKIQDQTTIDITVGGVPVTRFVRSYGEAKTGDLVALLGSSGSLEIAEVNGNASVRLDARGGDPITVRLKDLSSGRG